MSSSLPTEAPATAFTCECEWLARSVCNGLPFFKEHEGKRYCVLHYPDKDKVAAFNEALNRKLEAKNFNFHGVWFPGVLDFRDFTFIKPASFISAKFSEGAFFHRSTFRAEADFSHTKFSNETGANFDYANFAEEANFDYANFGAATSFDSVNFGAKASFDSATFWAKADFNAAVFSAEAVFSYAKFSAEVDFDSAVFKDYVRFAGDEETQVFGDNSSLSLQFARIEKPDRFSFHTLRLRPHWFVNVDSRKFEFVAVEWNWNKIKIKREIKSLQSRGISPAHHLLELACRNLALNAEENHRYERASSFRYMAMEIRRLEGWQGWRYLASWLLNWWYWFASGYGERIGRAFVVLIGIWLLAAALYTGVGFVRWEPRVATEAEAVEARRDEVGKPLSLQRALTYSLGVMTLQKPEPKPATNTAHALVMLETILGPVQAALLALAIRRKFMR
jgi:uncharacterized protein YjbI with pentapeptide repeats